MSGPRVIARRVADVRAATVRAAAERIAAERIAAVRSIAARTATLVAVAAFVATGAGAQRRERIVGLPCEGCEHVFDGRPATIGATTTIATAREPGDRLLLTGTVRDAAGRAVPGTIVYAYHVDARGHYRPPSPTDGGVATPHGALRGWARTDAQGRYAFATIRPTWYPARDTPQHVHLHVIEPGRCTYYIDDVLFADDPLLTAAHRRTMRTGRGGDALVTPRRDAAGTWHATRDIVLGALVPGYASCGGS
jgi:protocatechuate 3,4-dioxygenase beta subunit